MRTGVCVCVCVCLCVSERERERERERECVCVCELEEEEEEVLHFTEIAHEFALLPHIQITTESSQKVRNQAKFVLVQFSF